MAWSFSTPRQVTRICLGRCGLAAAVGLALLAPAAVDAASCCGGGSAASLVLPKFSRAMVEVSLDAEHYDGFWNADGYWRRDPPDTDLNQYRLNVGGAYRVASRWQVFAMIPYVWNRNDYSGLSRDTDGLGDSTVGVWYEAFDEIRCIWRVGSWRDLKPAVYWGAALTVPTGTSPYDDVGDNFDITGRGFYRLDGSVLLDKTIYPWSASLQLTYGHHFERSVNREYGRDVEPYDKQLGDRASGTATFGYTYFTGAMHSVTGTVSYTDLWEDKAEIDGKEDPTSGMRKHAVGAALAWAAPDRDWIVKLAYSHALQYDGWGRNFPTTDVLSIGVSHVLR